MEIPRFSRDEDTHEINPKEWLRMIRKNCKAPFGVGLDLNGEACK